MRNWKIPSAFWLAQALQRDDRAKTYKWEKARAFSPWLPEVPPSAKEANALLLSALNFLVQRAAKPRHRENHLTV